MLDFQGWEQSPEKNWRKKKGKNSGGRERKKVQKLDTGCRHLLGGDREVLSDQVEPKSVGLGATGRVTVNFWQYAISVMS